jgi:hypothetical protein
MFTVVHRDRDGLVRFVLINVQCPQEFSQPLSLLLTAVTMNFAEKRWFVRKITD